MTPAEETRGASKAVWRIQEKCVQKGFIDEIDAMREGRAWLRAVGEKYGAERMETTLGEGSGGICAVWKGNQMLAYFIVVRDLFNRSMLVTHDLANGAPKEADSATAHSDTKEYGLPFETELCVGEGRVSIESQLGRELAKVPTGSPVEHGRVVGLIEGIEQLLMSLARKGIDLAHPAIANALEDCVEQLRS